MEIKPKLKILIFIDWFLPGTKSGGPVRSVANMIDRLKDVSFYIVTRNTDYCSNAPYSSVESNTWIEHSCNTKVHYISNKLLSKNYLEQIIISTNPKYIYINGIYSKYFSIIPLELAKRHKVNHIIASRGMLSPHALSIKPLKKKLFLAYFNLKSAYKKSTFHVTHFDEAEHIKNVISSYKGIKVIPNLPRKVSKNVETFPLKKSGKVKMIYLGRIAKEKGILSAITALNKCSGQIQLDICGTIYDKSYWGVCLEKIKNLPNNINVNYFGSLDSDKVLDTIRNYHALLLFSSGENYGHAIVESFLANRPVIISKNTPWKNLESKKMGFDVEEVKLSSAIQSIIDYEQNSFNSSCKAIKVRVDDILEVEKNIEKYYQLFKA